MKDIVDKILKEKPDAKALLNILLIINEALEIEDTPEKRMLFNKALAELRFQSRKYYTCKTDDELATDIIKKVGELANVPKDFITTKIKSREIVAARQMAMTLIKNNTKLSLSAIGAYFDRHYATVLHALKTVNNLSQTEKKFKQKFDIIIHSMHLNYVPYKPNLKILTN